MKGIHAEKVNGIANDLSLLRGSVSAMDQMKINLNSSQLHSGKVLMVAKGINFRYQSNWLWNNPLSFQLTSGQRIALQGSNGSGKTTLIQLILGERSPQMGHITRSKIDAIYIDQDYGLLHHGLTVYQQAQQFNSGILLEHEIKTRLSRFLFTRDQWDEPCGALSGGEKMRLMLCGLTIQNQSPDLMILDEPTNNLDLQNIEILTKAINSYQGTLVVASHDEHFLNQIGITSSISL